MDTQLLLASLIGTTIVVIALLITIARVALPLLNRPAGRRQLRHERPPWLKRADQQSGQKEYDQGRAADGRRDPDSLAWPETSTATSETLVPDLSEVPTAMQRTPPPAPVVTRSESPRVPAEADTAYPMGWLKSTRGVAVDVLLTQPEILIGRGAECNVMLDSETVSRKHCTLLFQSGRWYIRPFATANGTYLNEREVAADHLTELHSRDCIGIGPDVVLRITMPEVSQVARRLRAGAATSAGHRQRNEDSFLATETTVGVADGVGGRPAGDLAAQIAIDMLRVAPTSLTLAQFVPVIDAALAARSSDDPAVKDMATTLDAVRLVRSASGYRMSGVHIGDGAVFVDDRTAVRLLTSPHTLGEELALQGNPASDRHPERAGLTRAIGFQGQAEPDSWTESANLGDRFILSTDGLVKALGLDKFRQLVERVRGIDPQVAAEMMIGFALDSANKSGKLDNLTVVIADIVEQVSAENPDEFARFQSVPEGAGTMPPASPGRSVSSWVKSQLLGRSQAPEISVP